MADYTQTGGTATGQRYYQDVEISPSTLASGALQQRFDTKRYPKLGTDAGPAAGGMTPAVAVAANTTTPAAGAAVVLTATVTGRPTGKQPQGSVTFLDGATQLGTATLSAGSAQFTVAGGFTAGAHNVTAHFPGDGLYDQGTSNAVVVTAA